MSQGETAREGGSCPLCQGHAVRLFHKHHHWILSCAACGHRFALLTVLDQPSHIQRVYGDQYFFGGGAGYPNYLEEGNILRSHGRRYGRLLRRYAPYGTLLDVGCAAGFILHGLCDTGWRGEGIEPNARMAQYAREQLGLPVTTSTLEELDEVDRYDVVTMIQVIAHLVDPREAFQRIAYATNSGGLCLIETWNWKSATARLFGKAWHEYSPPSVLHWFSLDRLIRLASEFDYAMVSSGRVPKWIGCRHALSLVTHSLGDSRLGLLATNALRMIPENLNLPYPAEDLFWVLFRKNA